jgi:uncharacterized protein (DUF1778 family)
MYNLLNYLNRNIMKRGILALTKEEYDNLIRKIDITKFRGTILYDKLDSASKSIEDNVRILLSEDELETILDEIGIPISNDSILSGAYQKVNNLMSTFRS